MDVSASALLLQTSLANPGRESGGIALKPGQVVEATIAAITAEGVAILSIGDAQLAAQMPTPLPVGTVLRMQVQAGGAVPQLSLVRAATPDMPAAPTVPLPLASLLDSVTAAIIQVRAAPAGTAPATVAPAVAAPVVPSQGDVALVSAEAAAAVVVTSVSGAPEQESTTQVAAQVPAKSVPATQTLPQVLPAAAGASAEQPSALATALTPDVPEPAALATALVPATSANESGAPLPAGSVPAGTSATPERSLQLSVPAPAAANATGSLPPPSEAASAPAVPVTPAVPTAPAVLTQPTGSQPAASAPSLPNALPAPVDMATAPPSVDAAAGSRPVVVSTNGAVAARSENASTKVATAPTPVPPTRVAQPEAGRSATSLLQAQEAARPLPNARQLSWPQPVVPTVPRSTPAGDSSATVPSNLVPAPAPPSPPATPAAAIARALPAALAVQDSLAPLLQTLTVLASGSVRLPGPVLQLVRQILAQRVVVGESGPRAEDIANAVANSGSWLEARLATGQPVGRDLKGLLLALKAVLGPVVQNVPPPPHGDERAPPPLRDLPVRGTPVPDLPVTRDGHELVRHAVAQTDAALGRVKLAQIAALPDADPRQPVPGYRIELPLLAGAELVMAQLRIAPDGRAPKRDQKRGWSVKFAMNFASGGEVGAEIGILEHSVDVGLWAVDEELAGQMRALLPELGRAISGSGLKPGRLQVRSGAPIVPPPHGGHVVDSFT